MVISAQETGLTQAQDLEPLNFNLEPANTNQWQFWNNSYKLASSDPETSSKLINHPEKAGAIVLEALASRFHQSPLNSEDPASVTKTFDINKKTTIHQAREFLRQKPTDYLSMYYQGTSSAALLGIEKSGGKLLSISKQEELGLTRRSGEGTRGGAKKDSVQTSGISLTSIFETSDVYADLNSTVYHQTPQKAAVELQRVNESIVRWQQVLAVPEKMMYAHEDARDNLEALTGTKELLEQQLRKLERATVPLGEKAEVYPLVIGLKEGIEIGRKEANDLSAYRSSHEIDLKTSLDKVYAPQGKEDVVRERFKAMGCQDPVVLSMEAVRLVRDLDPALERFRKGARTAGRILKMVNQR